MVSKRAFNKEKSSLQFSKTSVIQQLFHNLNQWGAFSISVEYSEIMTALVTAINQKLLPLIFLKARVVIWPGVGHVKAYHIALR